jgi:hypothetical protein
MQMTLDLWKYQRLNPFTMNLLVAASLHAVESAPAFLSPELKMILREKFWCISVSFNRMES